MAMLLWHELGEKARCNDKKKFLVYKEIQKGVVAKSYMTNGLPHIRLCNRSHLNFLIYEENFLFFFISVQCKYAL
jgi:hypothetical protein